MSVIEPPVPDTVATGSYYAPHDVLGLHPDGTAGGVIRARRPLAASVTAVFADGREVALEHVRAGIWEGAYRGDAGAYRITATYEGSTAYTADDPYRCSTTIGELDLHLIREGRHEQLWQVLGSHVREHEGVAGTSFAVWAPHAQAVRVAADFNGWGGQSHSMRSMGASGGWGPFVPGGGADRTYQ